jgi:hypothetical protein
MAVRKFCKKSLDATFTGILRSNRNRCSREQKEKSMNATSLTLPNDFPTLEFEAVYGKLHSHNHKKNEYDLAIGAMHAMSYRFKTLAEYDDRFTASIKAHGTGPAQPIRYEQERDLFGFFSNAFSVFDTFCFGPEKNAPALVGAGMMGDRADVIFADPSEISPLIASKCE